MQIAKHAVRRTDAGYPPLRCTLFLLSLVTAGSVGCGTLVYKTGSTQGDYQAARERCQKEGRGESPDFERCMQDQGWIAKRFGEPAAPSEAPESPPAVSLSPKAQPAPTTADTHDGVAAQSPSPTSQPAPAAADEHDGVAVQSPSATSQPAPAASDVATSPRLSEASSAQKPIAAKNWFKLGGTAADLAAAKQRCATKLGATDHPDPESEAVTGEMLDCLRNEGWHAF